MPQRYFSAYSLALLLVFSILSPAFAGSNFSLTFDGQYSRRLSGKIGHDNSMGADILAEFQPMDSLAFGLDLGMDDYWGLVTPGQRFTSAVDLTGRFMPWGLSDDWEPYLIAGFGVNPRVGADTSAWQGNYQSMAGIGTRLFIEPQVALDFSALYEFFTPQAAPLQDLALRVGLSYYFSPVVGKPPSPSKVITDHTSGPAPSTQDKTSQPLHEKTGIHAKKHLHSDQTQ